MARYFDKLALLAKIEASYGVDAVPTGAANAMLVTNAKYEVGHEEISRDLLKPYMGHDGVLLVGKHVLISFDVEIAGSGEIGTKPGWAPLLRMAGFSETAVDADLVYKPRSSGFEAGSIYYNLDGVNHVSVGTRGNVKLSLKPREIPRFTFEFKGLLGTILDTALPAFSFSGFAVPAIVSKANTTLSLHGHAGASEGITIDVGASIEPRLNINYEAIEYVERAATGEAVMDATTLAIKDWWAIAQAHTTGILAVQHGSAIGNVIKIDAPAVQIGMPKYADSQKIATQALKLLLRPTSAGNDELAITALDTGFPAPPAGWIYWQAADGSYYVDENGAFYLLEAA